MLYLTHSYYNFIENINNKPTVFKIVENSKNLFIYISQNDRNLNIFSDRLKRYLSHKKIKRRKYHHVVCNMDNVENYKELKKIIDRIFLDK